MTASEMRVWQYLRRRQVDGWKFRKQAPIGEYIVDFYCPAARLVVELDGSSHNEHKFVHDKRRQAWLESKGYKVLRISAGYPKQDPLSDAWEAIDLALSQAQPGPPPEGGWRRHWFNRSVLPAPPGRWREAPEGTLTKGGSLKEDCRGGGAKRRRGR
jgi:very-short-patch-repair endonuclease